MRSRRYRPCAAFSLVELLIVVALVATLAGAAVGMFRSLADDARATRAKHDIEQVTQAYNRCRELENKPPKSIGQLVPRYLQAENKDPWGESYAMAWGYVISGGEDGMRGTEDDIQRCLLSYPDKNAEAAGTAALIAKEAAKYEKADKTRLTTMEALVAWLEKSPDKLGPPPIDPWGKKYFIDGELKDVVSSGPDETAKTDDDIHSTFSKDIEPMVTIPAGEFLMGTNGTECGNEARPAHRVRLSAFQIDVHLVTNERFLRFVEDTGHVTDAERAGISRVYTNTPRTTPMVAGANWRHPNGPDDSIDNKMNHPVVQVSFEDAMAFCKWAGKRLPTEAEFEKAARGGLEGRPYAWGDANPKGQACYFSSGSTINRPCPVASYPANAFGLYDMAGGVWEWCSDWYSPGYYASSPSDNPTGPGGGGAHSLRGGTWFDWFPERNVRVAARGSGAVGVWTNDVGFRCVKAPTRSP